MTGALRPSAADALAEWADRVRRNREQVERFRESEDGPDFYGPIAAQFKADPRRTDEPALDLLRALVQPGETWLDIGAGGGRYALPLALLAGEVIALDPSEGMLAVLRAGMAEHGITNVRIAEGRWPAAHPPSADVAFIAHVGYDIEDIGPFLEAMEASARRLCVAMLLQRHPPSVFDWLWPEIHGEERVPLPSLPDFLALQLARGRLFEVRLAERPMPSPEPEHVLAMARRQLWVAPGSEKDSRLERLVKAALEEGDGRLPSSSAPQRVGLVSWSPAA
jgi:SAM-dependent methyltransferase